MHSVDNGPKTVLSPSEPDQNHDSAVIDRRTAANRQNALKSTGPRTKKGKSAIAKNSIAHGIYASYFVIRPMESPQEWNRYLAEMMASMVPCGMLETTLAESVTVTFWRLRRAIRYESEQALLVQKGAREVIRDRLYKEAKGPIDDAVKSVEYNLIAIVNKYDSENGETPDDEDDIPDDRELDEGDAQYLLSCIHDDLGGAKLFDEYWRRLPKPEVWNAALVRRLVQEFADQAFQSRWKHLAEDFEERLDEYRRENLLPDDETREKVVRYEAHLNRQLHRDLHELQRLQATRQGKPVVAPVAIDVDVSNGAHSKPETGG